MGFLPQLTTFCFCEINCFKKGLILIPIRFPHVSSHDPGKKGDVLFSGLKVKKSIRYNVCGVIKILEWRDMQLTGVALE